MNILLIVHFVLVEYVASKSSLIFAALSQLLVMIFKGFFLNVFKISIGGFP